MGKGDKRTRRGKIFAGSYGKTRRKTGKKKSGEKRVDEAPRKSEDK